MKVVLRLILFMIIGMSNNSIFAQDLSKVNIETIDTLSNDDLLFEIFKSIAERHVGENIGKKEIISQLTKEQQIFYAVSILEMQVNNGGFNQYFYNEGEEFTGVAIEGLRLIGANRIAALVTEAVETYMKHMEQITKMQDGSLMGFSESYKDNPLNDFDKEFYSLNQEESLIDLLVEYVRKNKVKFITN
jgi:hypothetical protein